MPKTLLLVFIHGFRGSDLTFHHFPHDLRGLLAASLPTMTVRARTYPQYATRGDLHACVAKLVAWLQREVTALEADADGVHVVLCGHSMGGIVAAEAVLSMARREPAPPHSDANHHHNHNGTPTPEGSSTTTTTTTAPPPPPTQPSTPPPLLPRIRALLAFDTPYLGISPGVLAHDTPYLGISPGVLAHDTPYFGISPGVVARGAEERIARASTAAAAASAGGEQAAVGAGEGGGCGWGWGTVAGVAAAAAGVAGAAYLAWTGMQQGLAWAASHVEFVGCLARGAELQDRVAAVVRLTRTRRLGFANFYAAVGGGGDDGDDDGERTFCRLPPAPAPRSARDGGDDDDEEEGYRAPGTEDAAPSPHGRWVRCCNRAAADELHAHTAMFAAAANPDYHAMLPRARDQIVGWLDDAWGGGEAAE